MNRHLRSAVVSVMAVGMAVAGIAMALPAWAVATTNAAFWSMDEAAGSSVMTDNSGQGLHGRVGADVQTGTLFGGATGYRFPDISPTAPPARPEHLVTVPHTTRLNPESADYSVTVRYRTTKSFGNIAQKGQNATVGGYWKFEQPNGKVACLFKGSGGGQRTAWSLTALNDGQWHTVKCERTATAVSMYVDGVRHSRNPGWTGPIANTWEMSIGGKSRCDQIRTTCDYFVGDIDYVRVEKGSAGPANQPPVPSLATECSGLVCSLSAAGSTDADGAIQSYAWNFGDGSSVDTGSVRSTTHTYAAAGTYPVTLTVTDDRGVSRSTTAQVTVAPAAERIAFVGQATSSGNMRTHAVTVPASVQPGDGLVLFFSENTHATIAEPTGVTGWVPLHQLDGGYATSRVWRKVAGPGDAGTTLRVTLSAQSKGVLTVAAYRGTSASDPVAAYAAATDTARTATRVTPTVTVPAAGAWALSYWMHGDGTSTALTPPAEVTVRAGASQTGSGRVTTLLADSGAGLPSGSYGGLTATGGATSTTTTTWTVVLHPQG